MPILKNKIEFWWGTSFISYGKPTQADQKGCGGLYIENTHFKSRFHMLLYYLICDLKKRYSKTK
jgi:hypothetical protein